jgi:hypothetical protein
MSGRVWWAGSPSALSGGASLAPCFRTLHRYTGRRCTGYTSACRFRCPEDPDEPVRIGFMLLDDLREGDEEALREALEEADPATEIG